jgi:hypothetical protein
MKIRIKGNSIRYRLTKSDVEHFAREGYIEEIVEFGLQSLRYALKRDAGHDLAADFEHNKITIYMPEAMAAEWTSTDRVGFEKCDARIYLLVEKDFKCLDNVAEDQSDHYPNPLLKGS